MSDKAYDIAKILLNINAVKLNITNPFTFTSGIKSPIYCDNRFILGFPKERDEIIQAFLENPLLQEAEIIAGTSTAGIAWAAILADHLEKPMAYVRSEQKKYGAKKSIEGAEVVNKKVIIIEDLISTGGSSKKVVDILLEAQATIIGLLAIFSYEFPESDTIFENIPYFTLSNFSTLLTMAKESKIISTEEYLIAKKWNKNPHSWN